MAKALIRLDLNLLVALDALLATQSVTRAAGLLHVAQPSMSGSLARLREHFGDPLLQAVGRRMERTALGDALVQPVKEALEKVDAAISVRPTFDPQGSRRRFTVSGTELSAWNLLSALVGDIAQVAPGIAIDVLPGDPQIAAERLVRRELDFSFVAERFALPGHPARLVLQDRFCCVVWKGNKAVRGRLTLEAYQRLGHAVARYGFERRPSFEQSSLDEAGIQRREEISAPSSAVAAPMVVGTDRIATLPVTMAQQLARAFPLRVLELPFAMPPLRIVMQWHQNRSRDGAMVWFREQVLATSRRLGLGADGNVAA